MLRSPLFALIVFATAYGIILELLLIAAILYWPSFAENIEAFRLIAPLPFMKEAADYIEVGGAVPYVNAQHYFKGCNTLGTAAAVLFAVGAVAGEAHRGTLEIWLARPMSRLRMLSQRYVSGALALAVPVFLTSATIPMLAERVEEYLDLWPFMLCSAHQVCLLLGIYSLTFLLSTLGSNPTRIALVMLFVTTFAFAIYMIQTVTHYSLYRLTDIPDFQRIHDELGLDWTVCGPLLGASALLFTASVVAFRYRVP